MDLQNLLALASAALGFAASMWFAVGALVSGSKQIAAVGGGYWDYNAPLIRALCEQRAQYIAGAALLTVAFALQLAALNAPHVSVRLVPAFLTRSSVAAALVILAVAGWVSWLLVGVIAERTFKAALAAAKATVSSEG